MLVDLVQTLTRDEVRLDGAYQASPRAGAAGLAVDAFCLVHGTGGSFYSSPLFDTLAERLLALGCGILRGNTRGHDLMSTAATPRGGRRQGAAYEVVDDCRHDVAWIGWLRQHAGPRVGLLGHSLGAVKCLYAQAREPHPGAACVLAVSPPRLSHSWFLSGEQASAFRAIYDRAQQLVATGQPEALLEVTLPLPLVITAAGYVEKYGPDERYNYLRLLAGLRCPTLLTLGAAEMAGNVAFRAAAEAARAAAGSAPVQVEVVAGADHFYTGVREELAARLEAWLRATLGPPG
jgi:alpha-beta hydrolase superfamily lysophospholipase